jgi:dTDP-4-amino-4,6-dideoxygalactose transaminase
MGYKIPLFDLNFDHTEEDAVIETLRSKWISTGPKTTELEVKFAEMLNVNNALAVANCTASLHLALLLIGIKPGDEIICPSLTFVATANAIRYLKAKPVFADIRSYNDLTIDSEDIERKITKKTKAIMLMHYGGFSCEMDKILQIANGKSLRLIEDACHGPLSEFDGKKLGTFGDFGCFSFFSNKNISTGEGGMLITNNEELFSRAKILRSHGMTSLSYERSKGHCTDYDVIELGYNYRMDDIRASIAIVQLDKLRDDLIRRAEIRKYYIKQLSGIKDLVIPFKDHKFFSSNYIFPVVLNNSDLKRRNKVRDYLAANWIQTSVHYPAVHRFSIYSEYTVKLPKTEYVADNLITLPMFSKLSTDNIDYIKLTIEKALNI